MMYIYTYVYMSTLFLAFLSSLLPKRLDLPFHLKYFSVLLAITCLVESIAWLLATKRTSNIALYNVFMLLEFWAYAFYYLLIIESGTVRKIIKYFLWLYPVFWAIVIFFIFGINRWNSYLPVVGGFFTVLFSATFYYQLFTNPDLPNLSRTPEFWIATGLILFYSCEMFFMGTLNYMVKNYPNLANRLLIVHMVMDTLMYALFIYAFLCNMNVRGRRSPL